MTRRTSYATAELLAPGRTSLVAFVIVLEIMVAAIMRDNLTLNCQSAPAAAESDEDRHCSAEASGHTTSERPRKCCGDIA
jgi:hypothetical protein